jgi:NAD dependent epimerase/dehydratase family enzyme
VPWIHLDDAVGLVRFALRASHISGAVNAVGPHPVRNTDFAKSLGAALGKPAVVPAPEWGLKLIFGEMAKTVVASQRVVPAAANKAGFEHQFADLDATFEDLLR